MGRFYSPKGNYEVWAEKPDGYYTYEEWKELHPDPPPPEPTKTEKLAALDAQYDSDKDQLAKYYLDAVLSGNEDLQAEIKAELVTLNADYEAARKEIEEE
jgi:hypothetical protein